MALDPAQWTALSRLLDRALELPEAEREAFVQGLPEAEAHLREPLRELLWRGLSRAGPGFLGTLPRMAPAALGPAPGVEVGPWRLLRELGTGGMGSVWLAERGDGGPARQVALKLPRWSADPGALTRRLLRERDALAALEHPNIARLYDAGVDAAGRPWLAMEYVDGLPLDRFARERALPVRARLELFLQVAGAVAYAHSRLLVHRDLKPANILVTAAGQARLLDFGIVKLLDEGEGAPGETTALLGRAFTPDYAAPEQLGDGTITVATDVYALGVVLFELLAGKRPYRIERNPIGGITWAVREAEPARLTEAAPESERKLLRGDLETIVAKALKKAPEERYATVNELAQDLRRHLADEPVLARPDGTWYRARKLLVRHRLAFAAAGAVLLALAAGLGTTLWQARRAVRERDRAAALLQRSAAVAEVMDLLVHQAAGRLEPEAMQRLLRESAETSRRAHAGAPEREAQVLLALASYQETLDDRTGAVALLDRAAELLRSSGDRDLAAQVACRRAVWDYGTDGARAALAVSSRRGADPGLDPQTRAECLGMASMLAQHVEPPEVGLRLGRQALAALGEVRQPTPLFRARVLYWVAEAEALALDLRAAEEHAEEGLRTLGEAGLSETPEAQGLHLTLADLQFAMGAVAGGRTHVEAILRYFAGRTPPDAVLNRQAFALDAAGHHQEAARAYLAAAEHGRASGNPLFQVQALAGAAGALRSAGRGEEARRHLREAEAAAHGLDPGTPAMELVRRVKGLLLLDVGQLPEARRLAEELLAERGGSASEARLQALSLRARVAAAEGKRAEARADAAEALALAVRLQAHQPASAAVGRAQLLAAEIEEQAGQREEALRGYRSARQHLSATVEASHVDARRAAEGLRRLGDGAR